MSALFDLILHTSILPPRIHAVVAEYHKAIIAGLNGERQAVAAARVYKERHVGKNGNLCPFEHAASIHPFANRELDSACLPCVIDGANNSGRSNPQV